MQQIEHPVALCTDESSSQNIKNEELTNASKRSINFFCWNYIHENWVPMWTRKRVQESLLPKGSFINHEDRFLDTYYPLPAPLWTILLSKPYVVMWTFRRPPPPLTMSTWFRNAPQRRLVKLKHAKLFTKVVVNHTDTKSRRSQRS